jgi:hypothetical protein
MTTDNEDLGKFITAKAVGSARVLIWLRDTPDGGNEFVATAGRVYCDEGGVWRLSNVFYPADMLCLAKAADIGHTEYGNQWDVQFAKIGERCRQRD